MRFLLSSALIIFISVHYCTAGSYRTVLVETGRDAGPVENNVAKLLADRLNETGCVQARIYTESDDRDRQPADLVILTGTPTHHQGMQRAWDLIGTGGV